MRTSIVKISALVILFAAIAVLGTYIVLTNNYKNLQIGGLNTQIQIERLQSKIAQDSLFIAVNKEAFWDMVKIAEEFEKENKRLNTVYVSLAAKYKEEKQKVKDLPADKSVEFFLSENGCKEYPVKYFNDNNQDSAFIIPIPAIKNANICSVEAKSLTEMNDNLLKRITIMTEVDSVRKAQIELQINSLLRMDNQKQLLSEQIALKDKLINAQEKAARKEKVKLRVTQMGAVAIVVGILLIM